MNTGVINGITWGHSRGATPLPAPVINTLK